MTIGNPAFCLFLSLTGVHFRGELQQVGDVIEQKRTPKTKHKEKDGNQWRKTI